MPAKRTRKRQRVCVEPFIVCLSSLGEIARSADYTTVTKNLLPPFRVNATSAVAGAATWRRLHPPVPRPNDFPQQVSETEENQPSARSRPTQKYSIQQSKLAGLKGEIER